jgi:hypothetical protein
MTPIFAPAAMKPVLVVSGSTPPAPKARPATRYSGIGGDHVARADPGQVDALDVHDPC